MYKVYCDNTLMYSDQSVELRHKLIDATLTLEDSAAGSFEFTIPPQNACYNLITKMVTHITVYRDNEKIWGGRAVSEEMDFYRNRTYFCEGELAYLNDTYQPLDEYHEITVRQYIENLLTVHNGKCNGNRVFTPIGNGPPESDEETEEDLYYGYGPDTYEDLFGGFYDSSPVPGTLNAPPSASSDNGMFGSEGEVTYPNQDKWINVNNSTTSYRIKFDYSTYKYHNPFLTVESYSKYPKFLHSRNMYRMTSTFNYSAYLFADLKGDYKYYLRYKSLSSTKHGSYTKTSSMTVNSNAISNINDYVIFIEVARVDGADMTPVDINNLNSRSHKMYWKKTSTSGYTNRNDDDPEVSETDTSYLSRSLKLINDETEEIKEEPKEEIKEEPKVQKIDPIYLKNNDEPQVTRDTEFVSNEYEEELNNFRGDGFSDIEDAVVNMTYNPVFFNVNMDARPVIQWNDGNLSRYSNEIASLGLNKNDLKGSYSTVLGLTRGYDAYEFCLTPIVQSSSGGKLISLQSIDEYMMYIVSQSMVGGNLNTEEVRRRDSEGYYINGEYIHHIVACIGSDSTRVSMLMHYVGRYGSLYMMRTDPSNSGSTTTYSGHQDKRIYPGQITVNDDDLYECVSEEDKEKLKYRYTYYETTLECINKIAENIKGHIRIRTGNDGKLYLDYLKEPINTSSQVINFGKNLLDYTQNYDLSNICTVLLPLGKKKESSKLAGNPVNVHWNLRSIITSTGNIFYGKNFYVSVGFKVQQRYYYKWVDSIKGTVEDKYKTNYIKYTGEQVNGYVMWAFTDSGGNLVGSVKTASNNTGRNTEFLNDYKISIPSGSGNEELNFIFAYYMGSEESYPQGKVKFFRDEGYANDGKKLIDTQYFQSEVDHVYSGYIINRERGTTEGTFGDDYLVSDPIVVEGNSTYYYTARNNNGYGFYVIKDRNFKTIANVKQASSGQTYTDLDKDEITIPAGGEYLYVGALRGTGIDPVLYNDGSRFDKNGKEKYNPPEDYVTVKEVNNGKLYVEKQSLINKYGWIERTEQWDNIETPSKLLEKANDYMNKMSIDEAYLEVKALDLHLLNVNTEAINLLDKVRCVSSPHGLDKYFPVTKIEIPLLDPEQQTFTLGYSSVEEPISHSSASSDSSIFKQLAEERTPSAILQSAKANATELLNAKSNGYVLVEPSEICIMDAPNKDSCTRLWRMNVNGIGYSSRGYYGAVDLAMTMDGSIVADRITTGFLSADRIQGGTLTLGGYENTDGKFFLKNRKGSKVVEMGIEGMRMIGELTTISAIQTPTNAALQGKQDFSYITVDKGIISGGEAKIRTELTESEQKLREQRTVPYWENYMPGLDDVYEYNEKTRIELYNRVNKLFSTTGNHEVGMGMALYGNDILRAITGKPSEITMSESGNEFTTAVSASSEYSDLTLTRDSFRIARSAGSYVHSCISYCKSGSGGFSSPSNDSWYSHQRDQSLLLYVSTSLRSSTDSNGFSYYYGGGIDIIAPTGALFVEVRNTWVGIHEWTNGSYLYRNFKCPENKTIIVDHIENSNAYGITVKQYGIKIVNGLIAVLDEGVGTYYQAFGGGSSSGGSSGGGSSGDPSFGS